MSLACAETGRVLKYGEDLYVATHVDLKVIYALSREIVQAIHKDHQSSHRASSDEVDIHKATSTSTLFFGNYTWSSLTQGTFLFSVSKEVALKHFPNLYRRNLDPALSSS